MILDIEKEVYTIYSEKMEKKKFWTVQLVISHYKVS